MSAGRSGRKQFDWEELGCIIIINDNHVQHLIYKVFSSKTGDITLPGGFKFKFTT